MFLRGNEMLRDSEEEVGGNRAYGGAILSRNARNFNKWLKVNSPFAKNKNPFFKYSF